MSNVLITEKREQVVALGRLGWPLRRIEAASWRLWGRRGAKQSANEVTTDPDGVTPVIQGLDAPDTSKPAGAIPIGRF